jgi:hypothetical protein
VVAANPAIFTLGLGQGQAAVLNYEAGTCTTPALGVAPGDGEVVCGAITPPNFATEVNVFIDGQLSVVNYAGTSPGSAGGLEDQRCCAPDCADWPSYHDHNIGWRPGQRSTQPTPCDAGLEVVWREIRVHVTEIVLPALTRYAGRKHRGTVAFRVLINQSVTLTKCSCRHDQGRGRKPARRLLGIASRGVTRH